LVSATTRDWLIIFGAITVLTGALVAFAYYNRKNKDESRAATPVGLGGGVPTPILILIPTPIHIRMKPGAMTDSPRKA
jgi:hypothetical protein